MEHWSKNAVFYHIYPLGFTGAPKENDFNAETLYNLEKIYEWIPHIKDLGANAIYLGPVFKSKTHGYDTADYYWVDRRLGTNETLEKLVDYLHQNGIKIILDGVFHHVGRDFWAFKDLQEKGRNSQYINWFMNVDFSKKSPCGDNFSYDGWNGHYHLVKLNLKNPEVKKHLFDAIKMWIEYFKIDGLRLDAADYITHEFWPELRTFCKNIKPDFYLKGEVIHGDYTKWVNNNALDSVTNYVCYKGLWSSLNDKNYFEISYSLNHQFGDGGSYKNLYLYNFADNHDVDRVASTLKKSDHLFPLYCLLFTMPGIPSIYYGSEWGIEGKKINGDDSFMRPCINLNEIRNNPPKPGLFEAIKKIISVRKYSDALKYGNYKQVFVASEQFAFFRESENEKIIVILNADEKKITLNINIPEIANAKLTDLLNNDESFEIKNGKLNIELYSNWARILKIANN